MLLFLVWLVISDLYLFHLIVLLNPVLSCSKSLLSFLVDKVAIKTYNFVSGILNVASVELSIAATAGFPPWVGTASLVPLLVNKQFSDYVKIRFIWQLNNGMSSVLQKLIKCLNGTTISTSFSVLLPVILVLQQKYFESLVEQFMLLFVRLSGSSL